MPTTPYTTLQSILCGDSDDGHTWNWDTISSTSIKFKKDGTGELILSEELSIWIASPFTWTTVDPNALSMYADIHTCSTSGRSPVAKFDLRITIIDKPLPKINRHPRPRPDGTQRECILDTNLGCLRPSAFAPKTLNVTLEKGVFVTQFDEWTRGRGHPLDGVPKYGLRLVFDPSPFPAREDWLVAHGAPDALRFWTWTEFCREEVVQDESSGQERKCVVM